MPKDIATDIFSHLEQEKSEMLIVHLSDVEAAHIIDDLYADDAKDLLEEMPSMVVKKLLANAKPETRATINQLLQYSDGSAGSIMTIEFVDLKADYTVEQAIARIRRDGVDKETINNCFVLDSERKLLGIVSLRKLLLAKPHEKVSDLMEENAIVARTNTDQEEVGRMFKKYDFISMPVCDSENRLVGIVTVDDIVDIIQTEALDDASYLAQVTPLDTEYLKTPIWRIWKNRFPWLVALMVLTTFVGLIISHFEHALFVISSALFAYVPLLMDSGGNAGAQSSVSIIRSMALEEIGKKDTFKVLWKEIRLSIILGLCLSAACFVKVIAVDQFIFQASTFVVMKSDGVTVLYDGFAGVAAVGGVISFALFFSIVIAKICGALIPAMAKKVRLDPAVIAAPFITTVIDIAALLVYVGLALLLLR
jgi:magnesium transporter